jgi:NAD(P)-dependent dehydrogenase (short-subunit alcohol dehydrogenase family)
MRLAGKVVLVMGGSRGIGAGIVERLAEEGASVAFTGRSEDTGRALETALRAEGLEVMFLRGSIIEEAEVKAAVEATVAKYGGLTTLVNNAAATDTTGPGKADTHITEISNEAFDKVLKTGIHGVFWSCKYAIPHLQAGGGAIVNISASSSVRAIDGRPAYQASKGGVNSLTRQIAVDYGRDRIRSNAIIVGFTFTGDPAMEKMVANDSFIGPLRRSIPIQRLGAPRDIANGVLYLVSDDAEYVTGVLLPVDGGLTCRLGIPDTTSVSALGES